MQLPRLFATGLWLGVTTAATAVVWAATSIVAADVTDRPAPVVAHSDVVSQLASGSGPGPQPTTTAPRPPGDITTAPPRRTAGPSPSVPAPSATSTPAPTTTTTPPAATKAPPATPSPTTSTTQASPETATYSTAGGVVGVSCNGFIITLRFAIPSNGFAARVLAQGPGNVDVRFVGSGQTLSVQAVCFGHPIRYDGAMPTR